MRKKAEIIVVVAAVIVIWMAVPGAARQDAGEMEVLIADIEQSDLDVFAGLKLTLTDRSEDGVTALVDREELEGLRLLGYDPVVLVPDVAAEMSRLEASGALRGYRDHGELGDALYMLNALYPSITHLEVLGWSVRGREIWAMKVSDNPDEDEDEAEIVFDGNTHGNEKIGAEVFFYLIEILSEGYGVDPEITALVDTREIWVVPMVNPDGAASSSRYNKNGVDLNRDFGYIWEGWGDSPAPVSQPETRALTELFWDNQFVFGTSGHSGTEYLSLPWSYHWDRTVDHDQFVYIGEMYDLLADYSYGQGSHGMYYIHGSSKDASYGNGTLHWTLEISNIKTPPSGQIDDYCERNHEAMLWLISTCGRGISGTVTDAITGRSLRALVDVVEIGWPVFTDPLVGDFHRYCLPGTYTLDVKAAGYETATVYGIVVAEGEEATIVDVALNPDESSLPAAHRIPICDVTDPNGTQDNHTLTPWALGPPDGRALSIGVEGWVVFDMRSGFVPVDGPGDDLTVHEGDDSPEGYTIEGSMAWDDAWVTIGSGVGTASFDLAEAGLARVHYLRITDDGDGIASGNYPGFDLDAVEVLNACIDYDNDGYGDAACGGLDCEDEDSASQPGADELCDGIDNNCDGVVDDADLDGDGHIDEACGGDDCDDTSPLAYPNAEEVCDGRDNDCDGSVPADEVDDDGDGYRICADDCDDTNPEVNPGEDEIRRNDIDDDCDGRVDEFELCFVGVVGSWN